ncbi:MAG: endonuclease/exonuclease/phosphatase family protein [Treponema sp.]|jgi:endonuclease/exonuclease/phosphatase family metal-dependent hydrolase|nr:endonuclease/exonuclease/phosphatase family protein [Treponema sp.]
MKNISVAVKIAGCAAGLLVLAAVFFFGWLSLNEYRPSATEAVPVKGNAPARVPFEKPLELYSWNIGYAALDAAQDFILDGGSGVRPSSRGFVENNTWAIQSFLASRAADFVFLQEVDVNSRRSYGIDQADYFAGSWRGTSAFALNYFCKFVPYPFPRFLGRIESGLLTLNTFYAGTQAERIALPSPFGWPVRTAQLKRCLLVERLPIADSDRELVLINLHMEAYDSGEGRAAQMRILADFLNAEYAKGNYCVAGGDFNANFPGAEDNFPLVDTDHFMPGTIEPDSAGGVWAADSAVPSARLLDRPYNGDREDNQFYVIDGFLVSPNVRVDSVRTIDLDFKNSDHNPVKLTFTLPQDGADTAN